jgi:hypothetical protein
VSLKEE